MGLRSGIVVLKAGEAVGEHSTGHKEEVLIILKGRARICCERKRINAGEHSFIYLPSYIRHNVENRGRGLLKYVYITSRQR